MSITCSKEFTLKINASSSPSTVAYYNCDSITESLGEVLIADSIGGKTLTGSGGTAGLVDVIAGKVSNGLQLSNVGFITTDFSTALDDFWNFSGIDMTVRFWFKASSLPFPVVPAYLLGTGLAQWYFKSYQSPDVLNLVVRFETGAPSYEEVYIPVGDTNWHRYVFIFKNGVGWSYKVDNAATVFNARTDPMEIPAAGDRQLELSSGFNIHCVDEIGIWRYALTEAQLTYDWNGGAGRTYP